MVLRQIFNGLASNLHHGHRRPLAFNGIRTLTSTNIRHAVLATHPPSQPIALIFSPFTKTKQEQELDVDAVLPQDVKIQITDRAAEVRLSITHHTTPTTKHFRSTCQQLRQISTRESNPDAALRIAVESGGCHGYQYRMELASKREADD
jgi:hypothetical protein